MKTKKNNHKEVNMCELISFLHNPMTGDIKVYDLESYNETRLYFDLDPKGPYREGQYFPDGTIECRVTDDDEVSQGVCNELLRKRFPTFVDFFNWCFEQGALVPKELNLDGMVDPKGLKIPKGVICVCLGSVIDPTNLIIPEGVEHVYLDSIIDPTNLRLPVGAKCVHLDSVIDPTNLKLNKGLVFVSLDSVVDSTNLRLYKSVKHIWVKGKSLSGLEIEQLQIGYQN